MEKYTQYEQIVVATINKFDVTLSINQEDSMLQSWIFNKIIYFKLPLKISILILELFSSVANSKINDLTINLIL